MARQPNHPRSRRQPWHKNRRRGSIQPTNPTVQAKAGPPPGVLEARSLWQRGMVAQALDRFEQAAADATPQDRPAVLVEASGVLAKRFETERAERLLDTLAGLPDPTGGRPGQHLILAGLGLITCYRPDKAMDCLSQALDAQPGNVAAAIELASLLERRGELDQAQAVLDRLNQPAMPAVKSVLGRIERRRGNPDRALELLNAVAKHKAADPNGLLTRARAGYELARLYDQQGDYDAAWTALVAAKRSQQSLVKPGLPAAARHRLLPHRALIDQVTPADFQRWQADAPSPGESSPRAALLTGLPRSGTTLLERILDAHPDILGADERHVLARVALPGLFDSREPPADPVAAFDAVPADRIATQRARYFDLMAQSLGEPLDGRLLLDKNPSMLRLLPGVARLLPDTPVIVALRDPRDVLVSMLLTWMPMNDVSVQMLNPDDAAAFAQQELEAWLVLRDKMPGWTELRYEALVGDLPGVAKRIVESLGLAWDDSVLSYADRTAAQGARQVDSPTYEDVSKPVYTSAIGRWRHYESHLGKAFEQLDHVTAELGYTTT
ncbi:MAG: sulfotransferase [Planctomycetota bacterium]